MFRGEINSKGHREAKTAEAMRKRKSGECQARKAWEIHAPETVNTVGNKTSREAHKTSKDKNVRGK